MTFNPSCPLPWLVGLGVALNGCQSSDPNAQALDADLMAANAAFAGMTQNWTLSHSCFGVAYPEGGAENFVRYLFSDLGSAEWPVAFDELEAEQMAAIGQTSLPPNVVVSPNERQYFDRKELVLQAQDGQIYVRGYLPEQSDPQFETYWELATVQTSPDVVPLCESNLDLGIGIDMEDNRF